MSLIGIFAARISRNLATRRSPLFNFVVLSTILMASLIGIAFTIPWFGIFFAGFAFAMMGMVNYLSSYYINREVDSADRATVLSFRGLALNVGLGVASLLYTGLIALLKANAGDGLSDEQLQAVAFVDALKGFPVYFALLFLLLLYFGKRFIRRLHLCTSAPG